MQIIPLSQGKHAIVDDEDYDYLMQWKWCAVKSDKTWYAVRTDRTGGEKQVRMHRVILGAPDGIEVDHVDQNGLHNWRKNLRPCTRAQNLRNRKKFKNNTSGYKGVSPFKGNKFQAKIRVNGKLHHLGLFTDIIEAAKSYDKAARKFFGIFAKTNFE